MLKGKVALITGAARGIGRCYALHLAGLGADVVVNDKNLHSYEEYDSEKDQMRATNVVEEIKDLGQRAIGIEADVSNKKEVHGMFQTIIEEFGKLDILITNAGMSSGELETTYASNVSLSDLDETLNVNLKGTIFCCQLASGIMKKRRTGKIITVSSIAAIRPRVPSLSHYALAKSSIITYSRYLALELAAYNINVNVIAPGIIVTGRIEEIGLNKKTQDLIPMKRLGSPQDCSGVIEFLCSDLSNYVTGQVIVVDGGMVLSPS